MIVQQFWQKTQEQLLESIVSGTEFRREGCLSSRLLIKKLDLKKTVNHFAIFESRTWLQTGESKTRGSLPKEQKQVAVDTRFHEIGVPRTMIHTSVFLKTIHIREHLRGTLKSYASARKRDGSLGNHPLGSLNQPQG